MVTPYDTRLPADLRTLKEEIEVYAREYGLDFYETIFEVIDGEDLNEIAAYGGFPTRYPHWSFGMSFEELKKGYDYGLSKIYEMVINNDPCYAYLMRCNHVVDQKLVMAHVYGHNDFFKNNAYFAHTSRKMMDEMANHGMRIRRYVEKYGEDEVEAFMDRCMSIDDLIDVHSVAIRRRGENTRYDFAEEKEEDPIRGTRFKSKNYMEDYINPRDVLKAEEDEERKKRESISRSFPEHPEKDVLLFLIQFAPLKPWQRDMLSIIRDEAYYFAPQGQTKIMNEGWACLSYKSLIFTDLGIIRAGDLVENRHEVQVSDGQTTRRVYDWARFENRETILLRTRRGLELHGSTTHRVLLPDGTWRRLDELQIGDKLLVSGAKNLWAKETVCLNWQPVRRMNLSDVAVKAGVSSRAVRYRRYHCQEQIDDNLGILLKEYEANLAITNHMQNRRRTIRVPQIVDQKLAAFLGYLTGDGHISSVKRVIGLTTGDEEQADTFATLVTDLFGLRTRKKRDGNRWRMIFSSRDVQEFLQHLGLKTGSCARIKEIPDAILRSPKSVVASFLQAYFDCDGYAGKQGVILSSASDSLSQQVQLLLLNFGILSRRRKQGDGCWHVHITGPSAQVFADEIGFGLVCKQQALQDYLGERQWFKEESWDDEVVSLERGRADVYDFSVSATHRYVAQGFVNHNSYWHSTMMTQKILTGSEVIDYADHHSGTMATSPGRLNPYKLGIELFRDIEHRWNTGKFGKEYDDCDDMEIRRKWDKQLGLGRKKIFEVRKIYNDITFIDTFLTPEFCVKYKLFSYAFDEQMGQYFIETREFQKIKQRLLFSLTNVGRPWIYVVDGNYRNRGELLLRHEYNGLELKLDRAADTLSNVQFLWSRPVHLQTVVEDKPTLLSFDGSEHSIKTMGEADDPRKQPASKPF
jgi:stage V sporulation protein R